MLQVASVIALLFTSLLIVQVLCQSRARLNPIKQQPEQPNNFRDIAKENSDDLDTRRNVSEIIRSRGFLVQEFDVITRDGYILSIQRIINPLVKPEYRSKMKPIIMQHGLMSSSVNWVINSVDVRPEVYPRGRERFSSFKLPNRPGDSQEHPNSLGYYMANRGYDVFLANSRGNVYGQRHVRMSSWNPKFWDFTFDDMIKFDLPDTIKFVQKLTGHTKIAYVGHSQGTTIMFGLLADKPEYADVIEPFIALAPVAYVDHCTSPIKYFSIYTPIAQNIDAPFVTSQAAIKFLAPIVCGASLIENRKLCNNLLFLAVGLNKEELDPRRVDAYLAHSASGSSVKNIAHFGQGLISRSFARFDYGILGNELRYKTARPPAYELKKIRSKSIALFVADKDLLAPPKDVAHLRADLTVKPYAVFNITKDEPNWNHIDFIYGKNAGKFINTKIEQVMEKFR